MMNGRWWVVIAAAVLAFGLLTAVATAVVEEGAAPPAEAAKEAETQAGWAGSRIMWASLTMLFATFATSWAQSRIGIAGAGALAEKPELAGTYIILIAIPETMVILGFVVAAMILTLE
jgi:V/A-type H+-transporting ATPase subunit K